MRRLMIPENTNKRKLDKKILIIFMIMFTEILGFSIVMPVIPFLGLSLGLNSFQIGLVLSIFSFCQLFASPITGKLSDRFGRKPFPTARSLLPMDCSPIGGSRQYRNESGPA